MRNLLQGNCETHTNDIEPLLLRYAQECTGSRNEMWLAKFYEVKNLATTLRRGYNSYNDGLARWLSDQRKKLGGLYPLKQQLISTIPY